MLGQLGRAARGSKGALYTQLWNGTGYWIQQEWANLADGCVSAAPPFSP